MTPLGLSICLHYYTRPSDFHVGEGMPPAVHDMLSWLVDEEMLVYGSMSDKTNYKPTDKLRFFVESLCKIDLPIQKWVMP